jgi:SSS family solute:Na+ symporter
VTAASRTLVRTHRRRYPRSSGRQGTATGGRAEVSKILRSWLLVAGLALTAPRAAAIDLTWNELPALPDSIGVAGPFVGTHDGVVIVAGGANFSPPVWEAEKTWHDRIWVLRHDGTDPNAAPRHPRWIDGGRLPWPRAYGASASTSHGVVCVGGNDATGTFADAFLLRWNTTAERVECVPLPPLPQPSASGCAAAIGDTVYVAAGLTGPELHTAAKRLWAIDVRDPANGRAWRELPPWPGSARGFALLHAQHDGEADGLYLMSGRRATEDGAIEPLRDVWHYRPDRAGRDDAWRRRADVPRCVMAAAGLPFGQSHIVIFGGDDGSLFGQEARLRDTHPGFAREMLAYHTITDTWTSAGTMSVGTVTTTAVRWGHDPVADPVVLPSGEVRPRVRTPAVWSVRLVPGGRRFGLVDASVLGLYLAGMLAVGVFFSLRTRNADDFFRGGQRVPWFVAGLSIFATMLSSITFMAIPAKAYATDWVYLPANLMAVAIAPLVVTIFLPFFRRLDAPSAYEYLERRFNRGVRLFASGSFVLFQVGRMAVVLSLSAIALAVITPLDERQSILLIGVLSIVYCALGGLEAVVWTDALQSLVLLGGALVSLILILLEIDGGVAGLLETAHAHHKLHLVNLDVSAASYTTTALWVVVLGGLAQALVPYTSDMAVVQRYMAVADTTRARRAIWTNAIAVIPASLLFFGVGTALFAFYARHPERLDPAFKTDAIFPLFISRELPAGLAGLVVAGVFAAAQSTISTSMNSVSTALVTDFVRPVVPDLAERRLLWLGRGLTVLCGGVGVWLALLLATADVASLWDQFLTILGLLGGSMCGVFCLGIFTTRGHGVGAMVGAVAGAAVLFWVQHFTRTHLLLYAFVGVAASLLTGYLASLLIPARRRPLAGLTIHTISGPAA